MLRSQLLLPTSCFPRCPWILSYRITFTFLHNDQHSNSVVYSGRVKSNTIAKATCYKKGCHKSTQMKQGRLGNEDCLKIIIFIMTAFADYTSIIDFFLNLMRFHLINLSLIDYDIMIGSFVERYFFVCVTFLIIASYQVQCNLKLGY